MGGAVGAAAAAETDAGGGGGTACGWPSIGDGDV